VQIQVKVNTTAVGKYIKSVETRTRTGMPRLINNMARAIKSDIAYGIDYSVDINGKLFQPLKPSTIQSKRNQTRFKGERQQPVPYPRKPLFATGRMQNVILKEKATANSLKARLVLPQSRQQIGQYHNEGTGPYTITPKNKKVLGPLYTSRGKKYFAKQVHHPGLPKREWFGISTRATSALFRLQEQFFNRIFGVK